MKKFILLLITILSLVGLCSCKGKQELVVYTEAGFAPFEYVQDGKISGVDIEIMQKVADKMGRKLKVENVAFDSIVDTVSKGQLANVGAAGISITPERSEKVDFSKVYYQANLYAIFKKDLDINKKVMTTGEEGIYWQNLKNDKGIGIQTGTTADLFLSDQIEEGGALEGTNKTSFDSIGVAANALGTHIEFLIVDELPAKQIVNGRKDLTCLPIYFGDDTAVEDEKAFDQYAICVTKGETEILNTIDAVLTELLNEKDENGKNGIEVLVMKHLEHKGSNTKTFAKYLGQGFLNTLIITLIAAAIGLVLGFAIAIIKIFAKDNKAMKIPAFICNLYTTIIRGTPVALQLFIMVFVLFAFDGDFKVPAIILTFGLNSAAYVSESIRAGIMSVDRGQVEAGRALGLSQFKTMTKIILPQAVKNVIPAIGNELIALVKETAIISMVGSTIGTLTFDLNQAGQVISIETANYLIPSLIVGCLYLIIVYTIQLGIKLFERRYAASDKR